jgi:hypothetical protein
MTQEIVKLSLEEFLRQGTLHPVRFGMSEEELEVLLGKPDFEFTARKKKRPLGLEYDYLEFHLTDRTESHTNQLCTNFLDNFDAPKRTSTVEVDTWFLKNGMSQAEAEAFLHAADVSFEPISRLQPMRGIITPAGVELAFHEDEGLSFIMKSIREEIEIETSTKQASITLPLEIYEKIRRESLRRRVSIAKLCSEWVIDKASQMSES